MTNNLQLGHESLKQLLHLTQDSKYILLAACAELQKTVIYYA